MIPRSLALLLTYKCNFLCDHCSVSAGPNRREVLTINHVRRVIEEAYTVPSIRTIVFTGGEPTLYLDVLEAGISLAHDKGFVTRLVTNAWWAKTPKQADRFLQNIRAAGLDELNVSYDDFHLPYLERFGGEQNVLNAVRAAAELGMTVLVGTVLHPGSRIKSSYLRQTFQDAGIQEGVKFLEDFVFPLGRARQKLPAHLFISDPGTIERGACGDAGQTLAILPDGNLLFCCGHIVNSKAQAIFSVDNLASGATLAKVIERIQRNVLYWWLHLEGPEAVLAELGVKKKFQRKCEACFYLGTAYQEKLRALAAKKEEIFSRWEGKKIDVPA